MQHKGDLIVNDQRETTGQITGTTYVKAGGLLLTRQPYRYDIMAA
jgi:hypothetical protein